MSEQRIRIVVVGEVLSVEGVPPGTVVEIITFGPCPENDIKSIKLWDEDAEPFVAPGTEEGKL